MSSEEYTYWGNERRHCNRMITVIFFGSLSSGAIVLELFDSLPAVLLALVLFGGSTLWILMYAQQREKARDNELNAREVEDDTSSGLSKVFLFPIFYVILALMLFANSSETLGQICPTLF